MSDLDALAALHASGALASHEVMVTTTLDVVDAADGLISLREAAAMAMEDLGLSRVVFDAALAAGGMLEIALTGGEILLAGDLEIDATGLGAQVVIDAGGLDPVDGSGAAGAGSRIFHTEGGTISLSGMTLRGGEADYGGAILALGTELTLRDITVEGAAAEGHGGAVLMTQGALTIEGGVFAANSAGDAGGAIYLEDASATILGAVLEGNAATTTGGAIHAERSTLEIIGGSVGANTAAYGGALSVIGGAATIEGGSWDGNGATELGGAILGYGDVTLRGTELRGNLAYSGGAIYQLEGALTANETWFGGNDAASGGGAIYVAELARAFLGRSVIEGGSAEAGGGVLNLGATTLLGTAIFGNAAENGAGILSLGALDLNAVTVAGNAGGGGALVMENGDALIRNSILSGVPGDGATLLVTNGDAVFSGPNLLAPLTLDTTGSIVIGTGEEAPLTLVQRDAEPGALNIAPSAIYVATGSITAEDGLLAADPADVFAALDADGVPVVSLGSDGRPYLALLEDAANPALGAADPALLPADIHDVDGDGDVDEAAPILAAEGHLGAITPEAASLLVTTTADVVDAWDGETSLREAVAALNAGLVSGTIGFAHGAGEAFETGGTILLTGALLLETGGIDGDLDGDGIADVTLDAQGLDRVIRTAGDVALNGLILTGGAAQDGAGIAVDGGLLRFSNGAIHGNGASGDGGAIFVAAGAQADVEGSSIHGNSAANGGAIAYAGGAQVQVLSSALWDNMATGAGGAIFLGADDLAEASVIYVDTSTIANNSAAAGGAIRTGGVMAHLSLRGSTVTGNDAALGAAILVEAEISAPTLLRDSIILGNGAEAANEIVKIGDVNLQYGGEGLIVAGSALGAATIPEGDAFADWLVPEGAPGAAETLWALADLPDLSIEDIFAAIDPATGGGLLAENGGLVPTVALNGSFDNPAIDAGGLSADAALAANGAARVIAFLDPDEGPARADLGAYETVREALSAAEMVGAYAGSGPFLADFAAAAADLVVTPDQLNGSAVLNFGADDALTLLAPGLLPTRISIDGNLVGYDEDGDGLRDGAVFLSVDDGLVPVMQLLPYGYRFTAYDPNPAPEEPVIGEVKRISLTDGWTDLSFDNAYQDPAVFAFVGSINDADPVAVRLRDVTGTGAQIRLQEIARELGALRADRSHAAEDVTVLVLEKGAHVLADGTVLEVGAVETNKLYVKGFETVELNPAFEDAPAVLTQIQSFNGADWAVARQRGVTADGFELTMQEEEYDNLNHAWEEVAWMAIEKGAGAWSGLAREAGSTAPLNGNVSATGYLGGFEEAPALLAALSSYNGSDPAAARVTSNAREGFAAFVQEETSLDSELQHGFETIDWLALSGEGDLTATGEAPAAPQVRVLESGTLSANNAPVSISFETAFEAPVVFATITSRNGAQEVIARISDVSATGFTFAVEEPDALDGYHAWEEISWMAVEAGRWDLGGMTIEAGLETLSDPGGLQRTQVDFSAAFDAAPGVLSQVQDGDAAPYTLTRMEGIDATGFEVGLEKEEALFFNAGPDRQVGWAAFDFGTAEADAMIFAEAGSASANHNPTAVGFDEGLSAPAALLAGMASSTFGDKAGARVSGFDADGFDIRVMEDTSLDAETGHGIEEFHWLALAETGELWGTSLL